MKKHTATTPTATTSGTTIVYRSLNELESILFHLHRDLFVGRSYFGVDKQLACLHQALDGFNTTIDARNKKPTSWTFDREAAYNYSHGASTKRGRKQYAKRTVISCEVDAGQCIAASNVAEIVARGNSDVSSRDRTNAIISLKCDEVFCFFSPAGLAHGDCKLEFLDGDDMNVDHATVQDEEEEMTMERRHLLIACIKNQVGFALSNVSRGPTKTLDNLTTRLQMRKFSKLTNKHTPLLVYRFGAKSSTKTKFAANSATILAVSATHAIKVMQEMVSDEKYMGSIQSTEAAFSPNSNVKAKTQHRFAPLYTKFDTRDFNGLKNPPEPHRVDGKLTIASKGIQKEININGARFTRKVVYIDSDEMALLIPSMCKKDLDDFRQQYPDSLVLCYGGTSQASTAQNSYDRRSGLGHFNADQADVAAAASKHAKDVQSVSSSLSSMLPPSSPLSSQFPVCGIITEYVSVDGLKMSIKEFENLVVIDGDNCLNGPNAGGGVGKNCRLVELRDKIYQIVYRVVHYMV